MHDVPSGRHADLPLAQEGSPCSGGCRRLDIGVLQHDVRTLAPELKRDVFEVLTCQLADTPANRRGAGRCYHPYALGHHQGLADLGAAIDDGKYSRWQPGLLERTGDGHSSHDRRLQIGLQYHGVPQRDRRSH